MRKNFKDRIALICDDFKEEIFVDHNMIMVHDALWKKIIESGNKKLRIEDALCDRCMELRIGRPLLRTDWKITDGQYPLCNLLTEQSKTHL